MKKQKLCVLKILSAALVIINIIVVSFLFIQADWKRSAFFVAAILAFASLVLGIVLIVLTVKAKAKGYLKAFLIVLGASSACFFVFSILHNFFYALAIVFGEILILKSLFVFLHVASFLVAVIGAPIGFVVGAIGAIVSFMRMK